MSHRPSGGPSGSSSQRSSNMRPVLMDPSFPAASAYLDHYLETVETVPYDVHRNFTLLREIDARTQGYVNRLEEIVKGDLTSLYRMDSVDRAHRLADLQSLLETMLQYGNEKDRLAAQTYELVEQHVRKLDADQEAYELESKEGKRPASTDKSAPVKRAAPKESSKEKAASRPKKPKKEKPSTPVPSLKEPSMNDRDRSSTPSSLKQPQTPDNASVVSTTSTKTKRSKESASVKRSIKGDSAASSKEKVSNGGSAGLASEASGNSGPGVADGDNPDDGGVEKELYCTCRGPSFGEMVGCDNDDCKYEWFHFQCMGLQTKPKGKWFCPDCRTRKEKK